MSFSLDPRESLRALEKQGEDYLWRTAKAAGAEMDALASNIQTRERELGEVIAQLAEERQKFTMHTAEVNAWLASVLDIFGLKATDVTDGCLKIWDASDKLVRALKQDEIALDRYRYAFQWMSADSWDGCEECRRRADWACANDPRARDMDQSRLAAMGVEFESVHTASSIKERFLERRDGEDLSDFVARVDGAQADGWTVKLTLQTGVILEKPKRPDE